jgi:hypothetical protein
MLLVSQAQAGSQSGEAKQPAASKPEPRGESKPETNKPNKQ